MVPAGNRSSAEHQQQQQQDAAEPLLKIEPAKEPTPAADLRDTATATSAARPGKKPNAAQPHISHV